MSEIKRVSEVFSIPEKLPEKHFEEGTESDGDKDTKSDSEELSIVEDGVSKLSEHSQAAAMKRAELDRKLDQFLNTKKESN